MDDKQKGPRILLNDEWPLKYTIPFKWKFSKAESMATLFKRLNGYHFYNNGNETNSGRYGFNKIRDPGMNIYATRLGIMITPLKLILDGTG